MAGGYAGGSRSRDGLIGWNTSGGDADADIIPNLEMLRQRNRDLSRNNPIGAATRSSKVTHTIGTGLKPDFSIDREFLGISNDEADAWEGDAERRFLHWWLDVNCDIERSCTGPEHQTLAFSSVLDNGDHGIFLTRVDRPGQVNPLAIQHIEADRICNQDNVTDTKKLTAGVEKDDNGAVTHIHVMNGHPGQRYSRDMTWRRLPAFGSESGRPITLLLYEKLRAGQTRGVPHLAPVIEIIKQIGRYTEAEIDAAVKNALLALIIKTETGDGLAGINDLSTWTQTRREYYKENPVEVKGGSSTALGLFPDDDVSPFDPSRPNTSAQPFLSAMFELIGMGVGIPYEVLINHFSASWSASQAALMQMWRPVQGYRAWLSRRMLKPISDAWLVEEVAAGNIAAPGFFADPMVRAAYSGVEWIGDAKGHINEQQQINAAKGRIDAQLSTRKREAAQLTGENWDKTRRQLQKEERSLAANQPVPDQSSDSERGPGETAADPQRDQRDVANG